MKKSRGLGGSSPLRHTTRPFTDKLAPARLLSLAAAAALASAQLNLQTWPNTAFAPSSLARALSAPAVALDGSAPPASSFRWLGSVGLPPGAPAQAMRLGALTDGMQQTLAEAAARAQAAAADAAE